MPPVHIRPILSFIGDKGNRAGEDRFRLLEEIDRTGSISAAAKAVGLSYKAAWDAVNALNNLFPRPMVTAHPGGKRGGGALVTDEGRRAIAVHKLLTDSLSKIIAGFEETISGDPSLAFPTQSLLWSPIMKTSARNTYYGVISAVRHGPVNAEVSLKISEDVVLTAVVTEHSAVDLKMEPGREAYALVKASAPILIADGDAVLTSARNRISGTVISVETAEVNAEVVLDIGGGKTLCATITDGSARTLAIQPGSRLSALIKASQIILATG